MRVQVDRPDENRVDAAGAGCEGAPAAAALGAGGPHPECQDAGDRQERESRPHRPSIRFQADHGVLQSTFRSCSPAVAASTDARCPGRPARAPRR